MKTFNELDVKDAFDLVSMYKPDGFQETEDFYDGEHWQKGDGFKDVNLTPSHWASETVSAGIMSIFTSQNFIAETVDRRTDGVLSIMPRITVEHKHPADEQTEEGENYVERKKAALTRWFHRKQVRNALKTYASAISKHTKCSLRLRVPAGRLDNGRIPGTTIEEVLENIFVEAHLPDMATVIEDAYSGYKVGIVAFNTVDTTLPVFTEEGPTSRCAEFSYPDASGMTVLKLCVEDGEDQTVTMDLGGNLTIWQGEHDAFISEQVKDAQKSINTTLTLMLYSNRESNFQQRIYFNAAPPGKIVHDPDTGEEKWVPTDLERGMDKDIFLAGLINKQEDGSFEMMEPRMQVIEPGTADRFIKTILELRLGLYRQCRQLHMELTDDATSTGEARMQAAADHEQDIHEFKLVVEEAASWALETAWRMAAYFADEQSELNADHPVMVECILDLGPIAAAKRQSVIQEVQARIRSKASARTEIGILDPDQEEMRVQTEIDRDIEVKERKAAIIKSLIDAGFDDTDGLLEFAGIEQEFISDLEIPEPEPVPPALQNGVPPAPENQPTGAPLRANPNPPPQ